jgi:hypothetical protein
MQPTTEYLLIRQISALISATADATSSSKEYAPLMEARLYEALAAHCAEKQRLATVSARHASLSARNIGAPVQNGLIYW